MALTATEEALVRQLLDQQAAILALANNEATITSKLGATKVTLADLVAASAADASDLLLVRQGVTEKSITPAILREFLAVTAPQFDNDTSLATTEFVQRALGNFSSASALVANTALTAAHAGASISVGSGAVVTLPAASSVIDGACINFIAGTGGGTIQRAGTDTLNSGSTAISLTVGDTLTLRLRGVNWQSVGGSAALRISTGDFASSLALSGYQKLPSGLIIQWGQTAGISIGTSAVTLPIAFPTACRNVVAVDGGANTGAPSVQNFSTTQFELTNPGSTSVFYYIAIGN